MSGAWKPRATAIAAGCVDVDDAIMRKRRLPCICPMQHDDAKAVTVGFSTCRGQVVEQVRCERCPRRWQRVNVR